MVIQVPGFSDLVGASSENTSESDEQGPPTRGSEKVGAEAALAKLIDAGDDVGEDLLASQLALIKPVVITARTHEDGKCVECESRSAIVDCVECKDEFCRICFQALHRKGRRAQHTPRPKPGQEKAWEEQLKSQQKTDVEDEAERHEDKFSIFSALTGSGGNRAMAAAGPASDIDQDADFSFRAKFIPVRLQLKERQFMRLLQAQMSVSTYTDEIDRPNLKSNKRVHAQIMKICAFLAGLAVSVNYEVGQEIVANRRWKDHEKFFQRIMEIGRRYKILNPDRMRTEYGRMMYLMMDAASNDVQQLLGFNIAKPMDTVYTTLERAGAESMLKDPLMEVATRAIDQMSEEGRKSRYDIRAEVRAKESAVKQLARRYSNSNITEDDIKWCLYSIGDNRSYLLQNRDPVQRMIRYLKKYFGPDAPRNEQYSLAIYGGQDGSRLTHSHERQYDYVLQSLTLWREILNDMFRLWYLAEEDMLDPSCPYKLEDTGQGLQRVQQSPRVADAMRDLLFRTQSKLGSWVGSSVVHLGDKNVPNALHFLDKYTQVSRILNPIVLCLDRLPELCTENEKTQQFIEEVFGGVEKCRMDICHDFFRSAFDGSGADNFFDAGSCIDGRLTSAWNWCSMVTSKRFFPVLKLSGFLSFDGDFQD